MNPGIGRTQLTQRINLAWGSVGRHIRGLQRDGKIEIFRSGRSIHLVPRRVSYALEHDPAVMHPLARRIVTKLAASASGAANLGRATGTTARRVQGQLECLLHGGLIEATQDYHKKYALTPRGEEAAQRINLHLPEESHESSDQP